jgi:hypothetical protein
MTPDQRVHYESLETYVPGRELEERPDSEWLRRLSEAATPGPWEWREYDFAQRGDIRKHTNVLVAPTVHEKPYEQRGRIILRHERLYFEADRSGLLREADAALIVAAVNYVRDVLDGYDALDATPRMVVVPPPSRLSRLLRWMGLR